MTLIDYYWHSIICARFGEFYLITKAHWNTQPTGRPASAGTEAEGLKGAHGFWCCPLTFWTVIPVAVPVLSQRRALFLSAAVCMAQLAETHLSEADCDSLHGNATLGSLSTQEQYKTAKETQPLTASADAQPLTIKTSNNAPMSLRTFLPFSVFKGEL